MREPLGRMVRIEAVASRLDGCFALRHALEAGFPRSTIGDLVSSGRWIRIHPGVFRVAGRIPPQRMPITAAWLACGQPAAIRGWSAACVWALTEQVPVRPEIAVPATRQVRPKGVLVQRTRRWSKTEMVRRGSVMVTSPMRTLLDLAAVADEEELELMLDDAHRLGLVRLERFTRYLHAAALARIGGSARLRDLVAVRDPKRATDSRPETKLFRRLRRAGIPLPKPGIWIQTKSGPRRVDLGYEHEQVALEYDSYLWHDGRVRQDEDKLRDGDLADAGWERRYITKSMLDDPSPLLEWTVATALGLRPVRFRLL